MKTLSLDYYQIPTLSVVFFLSENLVKIFEVDSYIPFVSVVQGR